MKKLLLILCLIGCTVNEIKSSNPIIMLYPCNNFSKKQTQELAITLEKFFYNNFKIYAQIEVENNIILSNSFKEGNRYNATKIISYYKNNSDIISIFLLNNDIFTFKENNKKWGIIGQSLIPGNACIVSTYRIKDKSNLWKVVVHEFCHSYFRYKHCPKDNPKCFMKDAKGHANLSIQKYFCNECKKIINFNKN